MRTIFCSAALLFIAIFSTGCASLNINQTDGGANRIGGLMGRLRGEAACNNCGVTGCKDGSCGTVLGGPLMGRMGGGLAMRGGLGLVRGRMAGGLTCMGCGLPGGQCGCQQNQLYTEQPFGGPHGPNAGHVGYPYYTTRAPRDFLMANPPSIGP